MKPNKFPGICFRCGEKVFAGTGFVLLPDFEMEADWRPNGYRSGYPQKEFVVQHTHCAEAFKNTTVHYRFNPV